MALKKLRHPEEAAKAAVSKDARRRSSQPWIPCPTPPLAPQGRGAVEAGGDRVERDVGPACRVHELFPAPIEQALVVLRDVTFGDPPGVIRMWPRMPQAHRQILRVL